MNVIVAENALKGAPRPEWDIYDRAFDRWAHGNPNIEGFATEISVSPGETVVFKVKTNASAYRLDVYRLGYYGGQGARRVGGARPAVTLPQSQPPPLVDPATGLIDCGNWAPSASWEVPEGAVSGVYVAKLVREDRIPGMNHIHFVVRNDDRDASILLQTSDTTWQAYNDWGGRSLYPYPELTAHPLNKVQRAYAVSYNRPMRARANEAGANFLFNAEYPMLRWLEANGYDVNYCTGVDVARSGQQLLRHKAFFTVGHDEYWSGPQRDSVETARESGVHLGLFTGNGIYWRVRWEPSTDADQTPYRTMVCYKETHADRRTDPSGEWTGTWRDPRFGLASGGGRPEHTLSGTSTKVFGFTGSAVHVPADDSRHRFWRDSGIELRVPPDLTAGTLGYEWDECPDDGYRPAGLAYLSTTTEAARPCMQDQGLMYSVGTATHHLTLYRHSAGGLVFSAATVQWAWGLDDDHDSQGRITGPSDHAVRQATVNLLADMAIEPESLQADLVAAAASTDVTAPVSTIAAPDDGSRLPPGTPVTISGTAQDADGVVAAVEVSVNGGVTWHPATGREQWEYRWTPTGNGRAQVLSRAVDDSCNLETPASGITVEVSDASGAPLLLVVDSSYTANPFGDYLTEILRGEGLNAFEKIELHHVVELDDPPAYLLGFPVVVLAQTRPTPAAAQTLRDYVAGGGRLIAMRPDPELADLFGLQFEAERLDQPSAPLQFFSFDTNSDAGQGIAVGPLPYHGSADLYALAGATALGWLWDDLTTPLPYPAVTVNDQGAGQAAAFMFDVARDVVLSRQGNPDWRNSKGDGNFEVDQTLELLRAHPNTNNQFRPMDMFTREPHFDGKLQVDDGLVWFEPSRLRVPHADEKQRFLANLILTMIGRPTPRVWYLPAGHRAVIVNTGDGESFGLATLKRPIADVQLLGGTFTTFLRLGQIPNIVDPITERDLWRAAGHEVSIHVHADDAPDAVGAGVQTEHLLRGAYARVAGALHSAYGHGPRTARNHTIDWLGWVDMAKIEADHGTGLDLNAYHFWQFVPRITPEPLRFHAGDPRATGYFTGSGLPQRFIDENGVVLPIYQLLTEWPDEFFYVNGFDHDRVYPEVVEPMLDAATSEGFVSAFVNNIHHEQYPKGVPGSHGSERWVRPLWERAQATGLPMWTAEALLDFVQTRNAVTLANQNWDGTTLSFDFSAPAAGHEVTLLIPAQGLSAVAVDGEPAPVAQESFKGRDYASFVVTGSTASIAATYL